MADRPILFSAPMVRALLAGKKTQTRRALKPKKDSAACLIDPSNGWADSFILDPGNASWLAEYVRWQIGDRLWVRETWGHDAPDLDSCRRGVESDGPSYRPYYAADAYWFDNKTVKMKPSIFMPRWASRLTLTVTDVRVQRLQDISEDDAKAEGCGMPYLGDGDYPFTDNAVMVSSKMQYRNPWNQINGPGSWEANPWVAALTFTVTKGNVDG